MELKEFTQQVASAFENQSSITPQTNYRDHDEWCSIIALTVMAVVRKKYRVTLKAEELRTCTTIEELFTLVRSRV